MWNLKKKKETKPKFIDTENRLDWQLSEVGSTGWAKWVKGVKVTNFQL